MNPRVIGIAIGVLVAVFGIGWVSGASGKNDLEQARRAAVERAEFAEARGLVLSGRVSLFLVNFGDASRKFNEAAALVAKLQTSLREQGFAERAGNLEVALTQLREAQRLAVSLDSSAQNAAEAALKALST
jgi:hypothetical protein